MAQEPLTYQLEPKPPAREVYLRQVDTYQQGDVMLRLEPGEASVRVGDLDDARLLANTPPEGWHGIIYVVGWAFGILLVVAFGALVVARLYKSWNNPVDVISEPDGKPSLARFQALVFTFAFSIAFLMIVLRSGDFPQDVPWPLVAILAGSLGTYLIAKGLGQGASATAAAAVAGTAPRLLWSGRAAAGATPVVAEQDVRVSRPDAPASVEHHLPALVVQPTPADYRVIAVGVGPAELTITPKLPAGRPAVSCRLRYVDEAGEVKDQLLQEPLRIRTYARGVSEVAAAVVGDRAGETITVQVSG